MDSTAIAQAVDPYGATLRSVTVNLNKRCPLACAHCSIGFSSTNHGDAWRLAPQDLVRVIRQVSPAVYDAVLFAGGEPSLEPDLLRIGIEECGARGLLSAVVTAPIWARTARSAARFLDVIGSIDVLILSYDRYHLEFLEEELYEAAAREAAQRGIYVQFQIVVSDEEEERRLVRALARFPVPAKVHSTRLVAIGNGGRTAAPGVRIRDESDLERLPRTCVAGNVLVDENFGVHGCCWARSVPASPLSVQGSPDGLEGALDALEADPRFQSLREHGFLAALDAEGRSALVARVRGRSFGTECDICLAAMRSRGDEVWMAYRQPRWSEERRP